MKLRKRWVLEDKRTGKPAPFRNVRAHTKGEARAFLKIVLGSAQEGEGGWTVKRLPECFRVVEVAI